MITDFLLLSTRACSRQYGAKLSAISDAGGDSSPTYSAVALNESLPLLVYLLMNHPKKGHHRQDAKSAKVFKQDCENPPIRANLQRIFNSTLAGLLCVFAVNL